MEKKYINITYYNEDEENLAIDEINYFEEQTMSLFIYYNNINKLK